MGLTDSQKDAIKSTKSQVIVTASAGAGKTFTMVSRVIRLISEGASLPSIIMLSFGEAAAQEMKSRLASELIAAIKDPENAEKRTLLVDALDELPLLRCSTIDSFCYSLVRSHFEYLGLPPTISVIDEETGKSYKEKAMKLILDRFATESLSGPAADPDKYYAFLSTFGSEEDDVLKKEIENLYDFSETMEDGEGYLAEAKRIASLPIEEHPAIRDFVAKTVAEATRLKEMIDLFVVPPAAEKMRAALIPNRAVIDQVASATSLKEIMAAPQIPSGKFQLIYSAEKSLLDDEIVAKSLENEIRNWRSNFGKRKDLLSQPYDDVIKAMRGRMQETLTVIALTEDFKAEYRRIKEDEGVLDFADVEHYAMKLLTEDESVAEEIGCEQLLIDESQDLNRLQEALMRKILGKGSLFIVGDVKQSIFRFRLAAPDLFNGRIKAGLANEEECDVIRFDENFRSSDKVIDFVNHVFTELMTEEFGGVDYVNAKRDRHSGGGRVRCFCRPVKKENNTSIPIQEVYSVRDAVEGMGGVDVADPDYEEACWIRDRILDLIKRKKYVRDTKTDDRHDLSYGDIAILSPIRMKPKSVQEKLVNCLREAGIPVNIGGFVKDASNVEISAIVDLLRLTISRKDDYALLSVFRSAICDFTPEELALIAEKEGNSFSEKAERSRNEGNAKLTEFYEFLDHCRLLGSIVPLCDLVSEIAERMKDRILCRADGRKTMGEILSFIETLKSGNETGSIAEYVEFFDKYFKMDFEGEIAERDAVSILTIHKSKGAQYPIVFVMGLARSIISNEEHKNYVRADTLYYVAKKSVGEDNLIFELLEEKKDKELKEDALRLMYVALTRAKNYLYISGHSGADKENNLVIKAKEDASSYMQLLLAGMKDSGIVIETDYRQTTTVVDDFSEDRVGDEEMERREREKAAAGEREEEEEEDHTRGTVYVDDPRDPRTLLTEALSYTYPHEAATKTGIKYTVTGITGMKDTQSPPATLFFPEDAVAKGTAYHAVMEYVSFGISSPAEAAETLRSLVEKGVITTEEARNISPKTLYEGCRMIAGIVGDRRVYREKSFILHLPAKDAYVSTDIADEVEVQGKIDLLAIGEDDAVIVDYKLSAASDEELTQTYALQLDLYEKAVLARFGAERKVTKYIFVLGKNRKIKIGK